MNAWCPECAGLAQIRNPKDDTYRPCPACRPAASGGATDGEHDWRCERQHGNGYCFCPQRAESVASVASQADGELREAFKHALFDWTAYTWTADERDQMALALILTPAVRQLLADAAAVKRVWDAVKAAEDGAARSSARMFSGEPFPATIPTSALRRALDGG